MPLSRIHLHRPVVSWPLNVVGPVAIATALISAGAATAPSRATTLASLGEWPLSPWIASGLLLLTLACLVQELRIRRLSASQARHMVRSKSLDALSPAVGMIDRDGVLIEINRSALEESGVRRAEVVGRPLADAAWWSGSPGIQNGVRDAIRQALAGEEIRLNLPARLATGKVARIEAEFRPVCNSRGQVEFLVASGIDVSARRREQVASRRRAEEEFRRLSADLDRRVAVRTAELARSAERKDEFLAGISHELRTPLHGILSLAEALLEEVYGRLSDEQGEALRAIDDIGRHLLTLINDVLDVARIEVGQFELEIGEVNVPAAANAAIRLVRETAVRKGLKLDLRIDPNVQAMAADERRLKQILVNLLSNAIKFTDPGGRVELEVAGDRGQSLIEWIVSDTGIGIAAHDIPRLFQPFAQLGTRPPGLAKAEGSGLGLHLVRRMAELHDGGVRVESQPGVGSRFTVFLPWNDQTASTGLPATPDAFGIRAAPVQPAAPGESVPLADQSESGS
jgi:PAS domain S-box-containing protein